MGRPIVNIILLAHSSNDISETVSVCWKTRPDKPSCFTDDHSNKSYWALLIRTCTLYYAKNSVYNFWKFLLWEATCKNNFYLLFIMICRVTLMWYKRKSYIKTHKTNKYSRFPNNYYYYSCILWSPLILIHPTN